MSFPCLYEHVCKFEYVKKIQDISTVVLGSSHLEKGFFPKDSSCGGRVFNFAISSQDLYYSYKLYELINTPNIKNIILAFSDFSMWHNLKQSPYSDYAAYYEAFLGIPPESGRNNMLKLLILKKTAKKVPHLDNEYRGEYLFYRNTPYEKDSQPALKWALRYNNRFYTKKHEPLKWLLAFCHTTKANGQNLIIVITPIFDKLFKRISIKEDDLFKELYLLTEQYSNVRIENYRDSENFFESDFEDWEHLNQHGAKKLTKSIMEKLYTA